MKTIDTKSAETLTQLQILIKQLEEINNQFALLLATLPTLKPSMTPSQPSSAHSHQPDALKATLPNSVMIYQDALPTLSPPSGTLSIPMITFTMPNTKQILTPPPTLHPCSPN